MPFETMQEVSHPGSSENDWNKSILQKEQLLTGKTDDNEKRTADQKALTDKGLIPEIEFEDSSNLKTPTEFSCSIQEASEATKETQERNSDHSETGKSTNQGGIFSRFDKNDNNQISAKEWVDRFDRIAGEDQKANERDFFRAFGRNERTEAFFKAANSNGDRNVTMTEWMKYYQKVEGKDGNFTVGRKELRRNIRNHMDGGDSGGNDGGGDGGDNNTEQFVTKPDLSKYESQEHMEYVARLAAHEQQLNGSTQKNGPQGTIFLQTLLDAETGGKLNGQSDIFLKGDTPEETAQRRQWFFDAMADSINPETGKLDGRVLSQSIVDTFYDATGKDISGSINKAEHLSAQTSNEALSVAGPGQPEDPDFIDKMSESSGWSKEEIAWDLLWGHAQIFSEDGKLTDDGVRQFLSDALNGKDDRTSGLIKMFPEIEKSTREILNSDHPAKLLDELFLASQARQYGVDIGGVSPIGDDEQDNGDNDYMFNTADQSNGQKPSIFDRFFSDIQRAADSGNKNFVNQALDNFGNKFQSLANNLLKSRSTGGEGGEQQDMNNNTQQKCPFMALKDKFGGAK